MEEYVTEDIMIEILCYLSIQDILSCRLINSKFLNACKYYQGNISIEAPIYLEKAKRIFPRADFKYKTFMIPLTSQENESYWFEMIPKFCFLFENKYCELAKKSQIERGNCNILSAPKCNCCDTLHPCLDLNMPGSLQNLYSCSWLLCTEREMSNMSDLLSEAPIIKSIMEILMLIWESHQSLCAESNWLLSPINSLNIIVNAHIRQSTFGFVDESTMVLVLGAMKMKDYNEFGLYIHEHVICFLFGNLILKWWIQDFPFQRDEHSDVTAIQVAIGVLINHHCRYNGCLLKYLWKSSYHPLHKSTCAYQNSIYLTEVSNFGQRIRILIKCIRMQILSGSSLDIESILENMHDFSFSKHEKINVKLALLRLKQ